jgi:hypothetical protein
MEVAGRFVLFALLLLMGFEFELSVTLLMLLSLVFDLFLGENASNTPLIAPPMMMMMMMMST